MSNTIRHKRSAATGNIPTPAELQEGELAINTADRKVFSKDANGVVFEVGGGDSYTKGEVDALLESTYRDGRVKRFFFMGNQ
jgi:hypothetical protein